MKILLTGCTSQHTNPESHRKSINFIGLIWETLRARGHEVFWTDPMVHTNRPRLSQFDKVIIGLAPVTSLGANRSYGALATLSHLWGDKRLTLVIDAPNPYKIPISLRAVHDNEQTLFKPFFSYRKEYDLALKEPHKGRILDAVDKLLGDDWPRTIIPSFPWTNPHEIMRQLPETAHERLSLVNLDSSLLGRERDDHPEHRDQVWAYEPSGVPRWLTSQNLTLPIEALPSTFRVEINEATVDQLRRSVGFLFGPTRYGAWWTPRVALALSQRTPVFSDWTETGVLGDEWAHLPTSLEIAHPRVQQRIGELQFESYSAAVPDKAKARDQLYAALGIKTAADKEEDLRSG